MNNKIWALLVHLTKNSWTVGDSTMEFDDEMWDYIVENAASAGFNTIFLDVGDGIEFSSHPEIAAKGAWSKRRLKQELQRCKEKGISLIPKLNFSATHANWQGKYYSLTSTPEYYHFCNDLIKELYELFEHPEYIHIGMDEEENQYINKRLDLVVYRRGELLWHDLRFLLDCVHETGAKPWIWFDMLFKFPEEAKKYISPDEAIISPWYYHAFRPENFVRLDEPLPAGEYIETADPFLSKFRKDILPIVNDGGYICVPCASNHTKRALPQVKYNNAEEIMEYFKSNVADNQILGYMSAPWCTTVLKNKDYFVDAFKDFKAAKETMYK